MKLRIVKIAIIISTLCFYLLSAGCTGVQRNPVGFSGIECDDGILYIGTIDGRVVAVNPASRASGQEFPSSDGEWSYSPILPSRSFFSCSSSPAPVSIYGTPVVTNDLICVGIYNGKVLMISPSARDENSAFPQLRDGEWAYPRTDDVIKPIVGRPVINGDVVYACCSDGRVYALDRLYGDELWKSEPLDDKLWISPLIKELTLYVSTFDGHI
jgi:outer membrane protein assembly factor BamB